MKPAVNLRGRKAIASIDGKECRVDIITHIRDDRWLVQGRALPKKYTRVSSCWSFKRAIVNRDQLRLIEGW